MARNILFTMTRGETGKVLGFKLEPTNLQGSAEPLDLTGYTVTLSVTKGSTVYLDNVACVPDPDQVANKGWGTFTFSAPQADLVPNEYQLRIKAVSGGNVLFFPTTQTRTYARLKVLAQ